MTRHVWIPTVAVFSLLVSTLAAAEPQPPLKVFILAGQSNMEGKAKVALLEYQASQPATAPLFQHLRKNGSWIERDDVWIKFLDRHGKLTVGYGSPGCIGPELEFGTIVGDHYAEPVLLIKVAWGGRSLFRDFRPPSAGFPAPEVLERLRKNLKPRQGEPTLDDVKATFGSSYRAMLQEVHSTLANLKTLFPQYDGRPYELAGFVWFQGWNDMIDDAATAEYAVNQAHLIRDLRRDLKSPNLPVVIGQMGVDGNNPDAKVRAFKAAQAATLDLPEFKGNVALVKTDQFWDTAAESVFKKGWRENLQEWNTVGSDWPYHYLGSARTMCAIGKALGKAMLDLRAGK